jgi:hypothetical protein
MARAGAFNWLTPAPFLIIRALHALNAEDIFTFSFMDSELGETLPNNFISIKHRKWQRWVEFSW